jgi:predicted phage tail protein
MINKYFSEDYKVRAAEIAEEEPDSIAGAGGCFPGNTLVRTHAGLKPISACVPGELILAYDRFGVVDYAVITELHSHLPADYADDLYFFFSGEVSLFPEGITGNHAVFDHISGEHKEAKDFTVGENLVDLEGNLLEITSISVTPHEDANCTVYNLTVLPQHTFFVGTQELLIRVHNGGGGKGGGTARAAQEAPNTLQSSAIAKVLEVISQGEIVGIAGGAKGVYLNGTPIQNSDNSLNFSNIFFDQRVGTPSQTIMAGFNNTESEVSITPTEVVFGTSGVTQSLPDANVPMARVTVGLPDGLWAQNKENGDLNGYSVDYAIQVRNDAGGSFSTVLSKTISGKTTSGYEMAHLISAPAGAVNWSIRVVKLSAPGDSSVRNTLTFARITEIFAQTETYDDVAYAGLRIPAKEVGNSIPVRGYDCIGIKVPVPSNYNPVTRTYTGYWNLAFAAGNLWTDNGVWILLEFVRNPRWGISTFLGQSVKVNLISFYEASLWSDCVTWNGSSNIVNLVPDGRGGSEVRYRFNAVIATQADAWQLLHSIASNFGCLLCIKGGQITLLQDRPRKAVRIINNTNVLDGLFVYSSSEITSRATAINITFNDINDRYLPRTISEPSEATLLTSWYNNAHTRYGYTPKDLVAYGCVTESQARRLALWALYTELNQPDMVTFGMALNICTLQVGDLIALMDNDYVTDTSEYYAGRVVSGAGNSITLDRELLLLSGRTYTLGVMSADNTQILEFTLTSTPGTYTTVAVSPALPAGEYRTREFMLYSVGLVEPREFLIQAITESSKGKYTFSCLQFDKNKWATLEAGVTVEPPVFSRIAATVIPEVSGIQFAPVYMNDGIKSKNYINVTWAWSPPTYVEEGITKQYKDQVSFTIRWRRDNNPYQIESNIPTKSFAIPDTTPGIYEVRIEAVNYLGKRSRSVFADYAYRVTAGLSSLVAPENFYVLETTGTAFTGTYIPLSWTFPAANETTEDTLLDYLLEVWTADGATKLQSYFITPEYDRFLTDGVSANPFFKGGKFNYSLPLNSADHGGTPSRTVQFKLYSRDVIGDVSTASIKTFTNAVPADTSFSYTISPTVDGTYFNITPSTESDVMGYIIQRSADNTFSSFQTYDVGNNTVPTIEGVSGTTYYYRVAAYDTFGKTGLDFGSTVNATLLSLDSTQWTQDGIAFSVGATNRIDWTSGTIVKNGSTSYSIASGNATWTAGKLYVYFDPAISTTVLQTTTTLATAVAAGAYPLATYTGGAASNIKGGDGSAFISGSQLIAGTVGASELITGSAVITGSAQMAAAIINTGHIIDGNITNAKIGNTIQSTNYNETSRFGWKIDKSGDITSFGALKLLTPNSATSGTVSSFIPKPVTWNAVNAGHNGNYIFKPSGTSSAWDSQVYSSESYTGDCAVLFSPANSSGQFMIGLNSDPTTNSSFDSIDFCLHIIPTGAVQVYESGSIKSGAASTYDPGDVFEVSYTGTTIWYKKNGVDFAQTTTTAGRTFFVDSSFYLPGSTAYNTQFGQYAIATQFYGARTEQDYKGTRVYDQNNILRVRLGDLS